MRPFQSDTVVPTPTLPTGLSLPPAMATSAATLPLLGLLAAGRLLSEGLTQLGVASEEVFRGSRLPLLKTPWYETVYNTDRDTDD
ncbi:MAG: hypothetical protein AAFQ61_07150 [Cyanobacteria bacterium J06626_23]